MQTAPPNKSHQDRWPNAAPAFQREEAAADALNRAKQRAAEFPADPYWQDMVVKCEALLAEAREAYRAAVKADEQAWENHSG